jgi:adenylosuccinate synthase
VSLHRVTLLGGLGRMPATIVVGAQWGDEGKGRVVDWLAQDAHVVARFNGGDNAGHTVVARGHTLKLHLVPSGILNEGVTCLLGAGVAVNLQRLIDEMDELISAGLDLGPTRLKLSAAAHVILPSHRALDGAREQARGKGAIGTTRRGIGPTYADKAARVNLRLGDMLDAGRFEERVAECTRAHNRLLESHFDASPVSVDDAARSYGQYARRLAPHVVDGTLLIGEALDRGDTVLCEGAQGLLLDLDHGTYPYVTSSSTVAGGALTGLGFGPRHVSRVVGVAKAYTTRVGEGPFPSELVDDTGDRIRDVGQEYGTTTGRPRRCGWLDVPILRYAVRVNGLTEIALTKLDVLTGLDSLRVVVAYEHDGEEIDYFPAESGVEHLAKWTPVLAELPGWAEDITGIRDVDALPAAALAYVEQVEEWVGVPINFIGVGPEREQAIVR